MLQDALKGYFGDAVRAFCFFDAKGCGRVSKLEFERFCHKLLLFEFHTVRPRSQSRLASRQL